VPSKTVFVFDVHCASATNVDLAWWIRRDRNFPIRRLIFRHVGKLEAGRFRNDYDLCQPARPTEIYGSTPPRGDLKAMKNSIGHQFLTSAGTAIGTEPVRSE